MVVVVVVVLVRKLESGQNRLNGESLTSGREIRLSLAGTVALMCFQMSYLPTVYPGRLQVDIKECTLSMFVVRVVSQSPTAASSSIEVNNTS